MHPSQGQHGRQTSAPRAEGEGMFGSLEDLDFLVMMGPYSQLPAPSFSCLPSSLLLKDSCPCPPVFSLPHSLPLSGLAPVFPFAQDWARVRRIRWEVDRAGPEYCGTWNGSLHPISLCFLKYKAKVSMTTSWTRGRTKGANTPIFKCAFCLSLCGL